MFVDVLDTDYFAAWERLMEDLSKRSDSDREEILLDCDPDCIITKKSSVDDIKNLFFGMGIGYEQYCNNPTERNQRSACFVFSLASGEEVYFFGKTPVTFAKKLASRLYHLPV